MQVAEENLQILAPISKRNEDGGPWLGRLLAQFRAVKASLDNIVDPVQMDPDFVLTQRSQWRHLLQRDLRDGRGNAAWNASAHPGSKIEEEGYTEQGTQPHHLGEAALKSLEHFHHSRSRVCFLRNPPPISFTSWGLLWIIKIMRFLSNSMKHFKFKCQCL